MIIDRKRAVLILTVIMAIVIAVLAISLTTRAVNQNNIDKTEPQIDTEQEINPVKRMENKTIPGNFFCEYRMERERLRGKQIEMLRDIINNPAHEKAAREAASLRLIKITQDMEKELKAESLVKSKGFTDCVVIILPETTTIVLQTGNLRLDKEKEIKELVSKIVQCSTDDLTIIVREPEN